MAWRVRLANRALRDRIFTVFDQTFAVTLVLRTVAILVAMAGTFGASQVGDTPPADAAGLRHGIGRVVAYGGFEGI